MKRDISRRKFLGISSASLLAACAPFALERRKIEYKLPNNKRIKLVFQFGAHGSEKDAEEMRALLNKFKPHVVGIEHTGLHEQLAIEKEEEYKKTHRSPYAPFEESSFGKQRFTVLSETNVPRIFFMERFTLEQGATVLGKIFDAGSFHDKAIQLFGRGRAAEAVEALRQGLELDIKSNKMREKHINNTLSNLHATLTKRFPELEREPEIRVVIRYGALHTPLFRQALKSGYGAAKREMKTPTYYLLGDALVRRATFGLPQKTDKNSLAQAFIAGLIAFKTRGLTRSLNNSAAFANLAARRFNYDDFVRISQRVAKQKEPLFIAFEEAMKEEGVHIPRTKEELRTVLARKIGEKRVAEE